MTPIARIYLDGYLAYGAIAAVACSIRYFIVAYLRARRPEPLPLVLCKMLVCGAVLAVLWLPAILWFALSGLPKRPV